MAELVTILAGTAATGSIPSYDGVGYVVAGYLVTGLALTGYLAHLVYRARRARSRTAAVAGRTVSGERRDR